MTENMKKYLELISKDEKAQKKLNEQEPASIQEAKEKIIKDAAEKGITLTEEDFAETADIGELSEDELEAVAGGKECLCVFGGGGTASHKPEKTCACVMAGIGEGQTIKWIGDICEPHNIYRCSCGIYGSGVELFDERDD